MHLVNANDLVELCTGLMKRGLGGDSPGLDAV